MHKFSSPLAEDLYGEALESWQDDELGDAETFGWFALFLDAQAILEVGSQGFVSVTTYDTRVGAEEAWKGLERQYEGFELRGLLDTLTLHCDGMFLLVDTLKNVGSTPRIDELFDHVQNCADCDLSGDRQQVLDY